jgi:starch synthase
VYTIHNLAYQGVYPLEVGSIAGLPGDLTRPMGPLEFYGNLNMMKAGIVFSDIITTVSPTYAREIQTSEYGHGLDGVLRARSADVVGILNGADYEVWDPSVDALLPRKYTRDDLEGKAACKRHLTKRLGLKADGSTALVGMVSRMVDQKGFDIVVEAMDALVGLGISLAVLGTGDKTHSDALSEYARRLPGRIAVTVGFSEELAHLIEAGCDMFLMPSKYEPCGLNQLYSMRYGTIPIVRKTGGLADSVRDFGAGEDSTGFVFTDYSARALVAAMERAVKVFAHKDQWATLVGRAMAEDFSWGRSARAYQEVYSAMLERRRTPSAK